MRTCLFVLLVLHALCLCSAAQGVFVNEYTAIHQQGYRYVSPRPESVYVAPETAILLRFETASPGDLKNLSSCIQVSGEQSGVHVGQTQVATDNRTIVFHPNASFKRNEIVTVSITPVFVPGANVAVEPLRYQFYVTTAPTESLPSPQAPSSVGQASTVSQASVMAAPAETFVPQPGSAQILPNGVSVPGNFPFVAITVNDQPDEDYIFLDNRTSGSNSYNVIFDNSGLPIWYWQTNDERRDMKVQLNGVLTMLARTGGMRFIGLDTTYNEIASYRAVDGYTTDEHELRVLADGHYLLIGNRGNSVDMSRYVSGGNTSASISETAIQEFTAAGEMIFQWRAWDNYDIRDLCLDNPRANSMRFPHMNAIEIDEDGQLLVSCRHLSEVTKIDRDTGEIIWRLGGAHSDFTFVNDPLNGFENQHAIRSTGHGRYTLFDNGDLHQPSVSRGVEYELDLDRMTATVVWQYPKTPTTALYSHYMGNVQRLPNGNTLINWAVGNLPKLTEVRPDGTKAFEMNWLDKREAYRVWRCPWQGMAVTPYLIVEPYPDNVTLIFNQFGDPDVAFYRIYGGTTPQPTTLLATSTTTLTHLTDLENGRRYYFRVSAVDSDGSESDYSNEENLLVNIVALGQNMVVNGDFTQDKASWTWNTAGSAAAQWTVDQGVSSFSITQAGGQVSDIQLAQTGMKLTQGQKYIFEFDAWADQPRIFEAKVEQDGSPGTDYSRMGFAYVTQQKTHFRKVFTMQEPSDYQARVAFNMGLFPSGLALDNISLSAAIPGDVDYDGAVCFKDFAVMAGQWSKTHTGLAGDLDGNQRVDYADLETLAQNWLRSRPSPPIVLIAERDEKRVLVPTANIGRDWTGSAEPYNDGTWNRVGSDDGALACDGTDDYVEVGASASDLGIGGNRPRTFTAWVQTHAFNDGGVFDLGSYENGRNFSLRALTANNNWRVQYWGGAYDIDFVYDSLNKWVHFALVHTGTQTTIYANGIPQKSEARTLNTSDTMGLRIGVWRDSYLNGLLDDVQLYDQALDQTEVQSIMNQGTCDRTPLARWNLDETTGISAHDTVGFHDGILQGGPPWVSRDEGPFGVGYENSPSSSTSYTDLIGYDVGPAMSGKVTSCYIRIPFTLNLDPSELNALTLNIRYDDGFVAYINGRELTRANFNAAVPAWNDQAATLHDDQDALNLESFRVSRMDNPDVFEALRTGDNILAIHGLNDNLGSSDFLISPELQASR